jgi:hypothetical protein
MRRTRKLHLRRGMVRLRRSPAVTPAVDERGKLPLTDLHGTERNREFGSDAAIRTSPMKWYPG